MADEAGPYARRAARARPAGGSVQEQKRGGPGRQKLEAPGVPWAGGRERGRGDSWPASAGLRLHVEHVGRALVVPVPEAGVAWALQLQDILFPEGQREKEEEVEGRRDGREKRKEEGRKEGDWRALAGDPQEQTQGGGWNGRGSR